MRKIWLIFLVTNLIVSVLGSGVYANKTTIDTAIVNRLVGRAYKQVYTQPVQTIPLIDSIQDFSEEIDYNEGMFNAFKIYGISEFMQRNYQSSINYYYKAFKYTNNNPENKVVLLLNIALSHRVLFQYDSAFILLTRASELAEINGLEKRHADILLDMGSLYLNQEDYINSAKYLLKAADLAKNSLDNTYKTKVYSTLAMLYHNLHDFDNSQKCYVEAISIDSKEENPFFLSANYANYGELYLRVQENFDSAIYYHRKSIDFARPHELAKTTLIANINIGSVYLEMHNIDSAYVYYSAAVKDTLLNDNPRYQAAVYTNLGIYYQEKGNIKEARKYLLKGLEMSKKFEFLQFQQNGYHQLSMLEESKGNYKESLDYHKQYLEIINQIEDDEAIKEIAILDYEKHVISEKFQNELLQQENENQSNKITLQNMMMLIGSIFFIVLLVLLFMLYNKTKKIKELHKNLSKNYLAIEKVNKSLSFQNVEFSEEIKTKHRFVSILSHDLKNPFAGLIGLLDMINSDWDELPDEEKKDGIRILYNSSLRTYKLLEDLLEYGKAQQGLISSNPEKFVLLELVNEISNIFETNFSKKKINLKVEINDALEVKTDRRLFSQIIQNLIGNAVKYSHKGENVLVKVEEYDKLIKIHVIDTGIGIPNDKIVDLFRADMNFNRPGTNDEKSTGMGLILCKEYANIIEADIKVTSTEGSGSCFSLIIDKMN